MNDFYETLSLFYEDKHGLSISPSDCVNNIPFLPKLYRNILEYRAENKTYREIGELLLGCSHETVRQIFIEALQRLRRIIICEKFISIGSRRLLSLDAKTFIEYFIDSPYRGKLLKIVERLSLDTVKDLLGEMDNLKKYRGFGRKGQQHFIEVVKRFWGEDYFLFANHAVSLVEKKEELKLEVPDKFYGTCFRCDLNAIVGDLEDCILCGNKVQEIRPFQVSFSIDTIALWNLALATQYDRDAVTISQIIPTNSSFPFKMIRSDCSV